MHGGDSEIIMSKTLTASIVCYFNIFTCYCIVWLRLTSINKRI